VTLKAGEIGSVVFTVCDPGGEAPPPLTIEGITARSRQPPVAKPGKSVIPPSTYSVAPTT
jgi:hypothetical protein